MKELDSLAGFLLRSHGTGNLPANSIDSALEFGYLIGGSRRTQVSHPGDQQKL